MPDAEADVAAVVQLINGMPQRTAAIDQLKLEFVGRYGRPLELRGTGGLVRRLRKNYAHVLRVVKGEQYLSSTDQRVLSRRQWAARGSRAMLRRRSQWQAVPLDGHGRPGATPRACGVVGHRDCYGRRAIRSERA